MMDNCYCEVLNRRKCCFGCASRCENPCPTARGKSRCLTTDERPGEKWHRLRAQDLLGP